MAHETILYHNEGWKIIKIENEALKAYNYIFDQMKYDKKTKWEKFDIFGPIKIVLIPFPVPYNVY